MEETEYGVHEAYCDKKGLVFAITQQPVGPSGNTEEELKANIKHMWECLKKPILDYDNIPEEGAEDHLHYRDHDEV